MTDKKVQYIRGEYKKMDRVCEMCGETFQGTSKARFCSSACRVKDHRARKKQKVKG